MHIPVLLNEVLRFLDPKPGKVILDATIDGGGHAEVILQRIMPDGKLIGIDQDKKLLDKLISNSQFSISKKNLILINGNFRNLDKLLEPLNIKSLNGALYDLGMSSNQLEESGRGFSFTKNEPLIMTYKFPIDPGDLTAGEILNRWPEEKISEIIFRYGEERRARIIAKNIVETRRRKPFKTTSDVVGIIEKIFGRRKFQRIHPATKTFQALRIAVNDELTALSEGLEKAWRFLVPGSPLIVISFHSLEDRIVKYFLRDKAKNGEAELKTKKPITPSDEEIIFNPRSRSAKLRAAVKV